MNIKELITEAYETSKSKGWHDPEVDVSLGDRVALCHSELSEALEEARKHKDLKRIYVELEQIKFKNGIPGLPKRRQVDWEPDLSDCKPEGFPIELADVVIRIGDMCGKYGIDLQEYIVKEIALLDVIQLDADQAVPRIGNTVGEAIAWCHLDLSLVMAEQMSEARVNLRLAQCVIRIQAICAKYGIDLDRALRIKMDYNKTRSHRHGGKLF